MTEDEKRSPDLDPRNVRAAPARVEAEEQQESEILDWVVTSSPSGPRKLAVLAPSVKPSRVGPAP
jgi:hypothetical protein